MVGLAANRPLFSQGLDEWVGDTMLQSQRQSYPVRMLDSSRHRLLSVSGFGNAHFTVEPDWSKKKRNVTFTF